MNMRGMQRLIQIVGSIAIGAVLITACAGSSVVGFSDPPVGGIPPYGEIDPQQAVDVIQRLSGDPRFVLLDIRTPAEVATGHLPGVANLDFRNEAFRDELDVLDREATYLIYCRTANRTGQAFALMKEMGFGRVYDMQGGIRLWTELGYPICVGPVGEEHRCVGAYPAGRTRRRDSAHSEPSDSTCSADTLRSSDC